MTKFLTRNVTTDPLQWLINNGSDEAIGASLPEETMLALGALLQEHKNLVGKMRRKTCRAW